MIPPYTQSFPGGTVVYNPPASARDTGFEPWVRKTPGRSKWQSTPVFLPGEPHGLRSLRAMVHRVTQSKTQLRTYMHAPHPRCLRICSSTSTDSTSPVSRGMVVFTTEKNPHVSGPTQFKLMLLKGQMYL